MMLGQMADLSRRSCRSRLSRSNCSRIAGGNGLRLTISRSTVDNLTSAIMIRAPEPGTCHRQLKKAFENSLNLALFLSSPCGICRGRPLLPGSFENNVAFARPFHAVSEPYILRFARSEVVGPAHHAAFVGDLLF